MDEEFFFPQNVQTTYQLFGMGPKHLKRLVAGAPVVLLLGVLIAQAHVLFGVLIATILAGAYVGGCCYPVNGEETVADLWLHVRLMRQQQTVFVKKVEVDEPGADWPSAHTGPIWDLPSGDDQLDGAGVAPEPAPAERA